MIELVSSSWFASELANGFGYERDQILIEAGSWLERHEIETEVRRWKLVEDAELLIRLGRAGISRTSTVVIGGAPLPVARVAWALAFAGVEDVKILDGDLPRLEALAPNPQLFGAAHPLGARFRKTRADVLSRRGILADVRSRAEHNGLTTGYPYIDRRGRIEGSVFARGGPNAHHLEYYTLRGRFVDPARVEAMWRELGIERDRSVCFYCGTGWRASVAFLFATWLGFDASVYDGGWFDWITASEADHRRRADSLR